MDFLKRNEFSEENNDSLKNNGFLEFVLIFDVLDIWIFLFSDKVHIFGKICFFGERNNPWLTGASFDAKKAMPATKTILETCDIWDTDTILTFENLWSRNLFLGLI